MSAEWYAHTDQPFTLRDGETLVFTPTDLYQYRVEDGKLITHAVTRACVSKSQHSSMHLGIEVNTIILYAYSVDVPGRPQSVFDAAFHGNNEKGCLCERHEEVKRCTILGYGPGDEGGKFEPMAAERWENLEAARLKKEKARTYSREYQRRRKEKERQELQKRQSLASLREVLRGETWQEREDRLFEPEADENPRERMFDIDDDE
jgi:hypothetical protein